MIFEEIQYLKYNIDIENRNIPKQVKEHYYGNREYKLKLIDCDAKKIIKRSSQMLFRLYEGNGKAIYLIGVSDSGNVIGLTINELNTSFNNIIKIIKQSHAIIKKIKIYKFSADNKTKYILIIRIYKQLINIDIQ
jgi:elongation factor 1-alpha